MADDGGAANARSSLQSIRLVMEGLDRSSAVDREMTQPAKNSNSPSEIVDGDLHP